MKISWTENKQNKEVFKIADHRVILDGPLGGGNNQRKNKNGRE